MNEVKTKAAAKSVGKRAPTPDAIRPLVELCRAGRLFDVQAWIAAGKPVNLPERTKKRCHLKPPLEVAMAEGFHSLVQVLLQAGAVGADGLHWPMKLALRARRTDFVELLVANGFDPSTVDMTDVFETWDSKLMDYFIARGADVETNRPLARALCQRVQTALAVFKKYRDRFPSFREQANVALRHHCVEGNMKWVSLMLWAGADPHAKGAHRWDEKPRSDDEGISALVFAAIYDRFEVFDVKAARLDPKHPGTRDVAECLCDPKGLERLTKLLDTGLPVNDPDGKGSSLVRAAVRRLDWAVRWRSASSFLDNYGSDSYESRERMKVLRLLVERGGRWVPEDAREVNDLRKRLVKMKPEYTVEVVLIMTRHKACDRATLEALLRPASMKRHIEKFQSQIDKLLDG